MLMLTQTLTYIYIYIYIYIQGHFFVDINCAESAIDSLASGYNDDAGGRDPTGSESCVDLPNFASSSRPAGTNTRITALLGGTGSFTSARSNHADHQKIRHIVLPNGIIVVDCFSVFIACFFWRFCYFHEFARSDVCGLCKRSTDLASGGGGFWCVCGGGGGGLCVCVIWGGGLYIYFFKGWGEGGLE